MSDAVVSTSEAGTNAVVANAINSIAAIKHVFYINLEARTDRRQHIEKELKQVGFQNAERFNAVKLQNTGTNAGRVGCTLSHIKCLELARARGYSHLLICEDDTQFLQPEVFKTQLNTFLARKQDWDVILIAGNNVPPYVRLDETSVKVSHCQTTTCYLVNGHYFEILLCNMREGLRKLMQEPDKHVAYAIDKYWISLQKKDNWYLITPLTVVQREDYSDIEGRVTNYGALMTSLDKPQFFRPVR